MRCPKCGSLDDKVIDSRLSKDGTTIRRRRECLQCHFRLTTYESWERMELRVRKRDGRHEPFDRKKLLLSVRKACEKRPVSTEQMEQMVEDVYQELEAAQENEVTSQFLGSLVMNRLHSVDQVAYVRFASVYRKFQEVSEFIEEIESLGRRVPTTDDQPEFFQS